VARTREEQVRERAHAFDQYKGRGGGGGGEGGGGTKGNETTGTWNLLADDTGVNEIDARLYRDAHEKQRRLLLDKGATKRKMLREREREGGGRTGDAGTSKGEIRRGRWARGWGEEEEESRVGAGTKGARADGGSAPRLPAGLFHLP